MDAAADTAPRAAGFFTQGLAEADSEVAGAMASELGRQRAEIELIASENIVSRAVMEAQGSVMTNKYAEGYPGRRYYGGCQHVDVAEKLAIDRAKAAFRLRLRQRPAQLRQLRRTRACSQALHEPRRHHPRA